MDIVKLTINQLAWFRCHSVPTKSDGYYHTILTGRDGMIAFDKIMKAVKDEHPDLYHNKIIENDGSWFTISGMKFIWRAE